jgi:hypothetical protein
MRKKNYVYDNEMIFLQWDLYPRTFEIRVHQSLKIIIGSQKYEDIILYDKKNHTDFHRNQ